MYGAAATRDNEFGYQWHPKIIGDHSHMAMFAAMADERVKGMLCIGQNRRLHRGLAVRDQPPDLGRHDAARARPPRLGGVHPGGALLILLGVARAPRDGIRALARFGSWVLGMALKRDLLEAAVQADPDPATFESWLLERCWQMAAEVSVGAARAMALEIVSEWRLAAQSPSFREWLARGAPSDDTRRGE